ncbi:hypothetical protein CEXT_230061 [Caerostris extrusa]|uniref:Uncharacterized protein n=1 Tax=Caerostris extrusa TaxID=172846 RepID=A0AAV4UJV1_CAEEX|nr:hypothetical protein CEXT_230061 [Caerostris extrusa]
MESVPVMVWIIGNLFKWLSNKRKSPLRQNQQQLKQRKPKNIYNFWRRDWRYPSAPNEGKPLTIIQTSCMEYVSAKVPHQKRDRLTTQINEKAKSKRSDSTD